MIRQGKTRQDKTSKTRQERQDKTRQDETRQAKIRLDNKTQNATLKLIILEVSDGKNDDRPRHR